VGGRSNIESARADRLTIILDDARRYPRATYSGEKPARRASSATSPRSANGPSPPRVRGDEELAAELATLQFRDLRRTCVVYLGELGMDAHLIAGVTGHDIDETQRILRTYMPRTTGRAARAIALASVREAKEADNAAEREKIA
jgi:hypothetical protein